LCASHRCRALASKAYPPLNFIATLERSTGAHAGKDEALWQSGVFHAEVVPNLSPAVTFGDLLKVCAQTAKVAILGERPRTPSTVKYREVKTAPTATVSNGSHGRCLVRTVAVQTSRLEELQLRLQAAAAGVDSLGKALDHKRRPSDALLLLSGSHPARRLPILGRSYPDVYDALRLATSMRKRGLLPKSLALWAVANPVADADEAGVERVRRKVDLGVDVIITQPPLVWEPFERWLRGVNASGAIGGRAVREGNGVLHRTPTETAGADTAQKQARLLIGMPIITSPKGLRFWLGLCGLSHRRAICEAAFEAFGDLHAAIPTLLGKHEIRKTGWKDDPAFASPYGQAWFETTLSKLKLLQGMGVAGVHIMAPGEAPRRRARELVDVGVFEIVD
ncbi:unnamed protein product, partial [Ascophyllum nodosum]